ncbi:MAG: Sigma-70, region 4 [Planctomycetota bacterium]|jgi:DNA-directed RNA polymerase specialized sigma subunit
MNRKDGVQTMTSAAGGNPRTALISELLKELTRRERLVLALRYTEELTINEIAAVMEIAVTEVERMLDSISERVRRRIAPMYRRSSR